MKNKPVSFTARTTSPTAVIRYLFPKACDEEEAGKQVGGVLLVPLAYTRLDNFIHHVHHQHLDEAYEATRGAVRSLAVLVPAGAEQDAA